MGNQLLQYEWNKNKRDVEISWNGEISFDKIPQTSA